MKDRLHILFLRLSGTLHGHNRAFFDCRAHENQDTFGIHQFFPRPDDNVGSALSRDPG